MISVAEAIQIVIEQTPVLTTELVPIQDSLGRVLAQDVIADTDLPPFNRSQMDGYAVRSEETRSAPVRLRIIGESAAGKGWHHEMQEGQAVRIMTGAPVPLGADAVQQVELTHELKDNTVVEVLESVDAGRSIVNRGSEVTKGETVLRSGSILNPAMLAVLASFGCAEIEVRRRPGVSVMATGSELVTVDQVPGQDQIRDSNNYSIGAYAARAGATVERLPLIGDNTASLKRAIEKASKKCNVIVTSGGVSMGVYDFTKTALQELGAELFFERVALRPGKPTVFGRLPNGALVFALPGNPVSVSVTFNLFARTSLLAMQGATEPSLKPETGVLAKSVKGNIDRESYLPAQLTTNDDGQLVVFPLKWGGSSDFVAFAAATALLNIPAGTGTVATDSLVKLVRLP